MITINHIMKFIMFGIKSTLEMNISKYIGKSNFLRINERIIYGNKQGIYGIFNGAIIGA